MKHVEPKAALIARPDLDWVELGKYLKSVGAEKWWTRRLDDDDWYSDDAQTLIEVGGKVCYRSWEPGLNPNVTKVRDDQDEYLANILRSGHGSVLEHANFTFVFHHISRVVTHELVRHRAGVAISQESMRYVRLDDIPFWVPDWAKEDEFVMWIIEEHVRRSEQVQADLAEYFKLDEPGTPFHEKKAKTSFMRRLAPGGVATEMVWTANVRTLRHVIESRTAEGAEEEIRLVFGQVAEIMRKECPALFGDLRRNDKGEYVPEWRKV